MLQLAVDKSPIGGQVLSMGMCTVPDPVVPALNSFKEVSLHFPIGYSFEDFTETIRTFDAGSFRPQDMVSSTISLEQLPGVMEELRGAHSHLKVMVDPHMECSHG
jgi:threonine dehydrogenase-like Zn-dependent dehydrogenase